MTADSAPLPSSPTPATEPAPAPEAPIRPRRADSAIPSRRERSVPHAGWMVVAGKEFGDHLYSARFLVLLVLLGLAALIPMYFAADAIRDVGAQITGQSSIFLFLFTIAPRVGETTGAAAGTTGAQLPSAFEFIAIVGPLLGLAFAFDAVNGERSSGTLPRLLSQPIYRDDVINGKFAAGLSVIGLVLTCIVLAIAAFGIIRLGIVPSAEELLRITLWLFVTFLYVALWLAFGLLLSVLIRRAATSALVAFGTWLLLTFFGGLITQVIGTVLAPRGAASLEEQARNLSLEQTITRLLPDTLFKEASLAILNPQVAAVSNPATVGGYQSIADRIPSLQSFDQSLLLVWPHMVTMLAIAVACFAIAYVRFMRQEVRA
jgi:ABC-2 type transport system permease protein